MESENLTDSSPKKAKDHLYKLINKESILTQDIENSRYIAYRTSFNILGVVLGTAILASGNVFLSILTFILFTPFSLMASDHKFETSEYIKSMNPVINLMLGTAPAVSYIEMIKVRNINREDIERHLRTIGKISRKDVLEMLSMVSSNKVKLLLFDHYKENL